MDRAQVREIAKLNIGRWNFVRRQPSLVGTRYDADHSV
jgi:hypothetical protein